ncbi:hypothetical protein [Campylobacter curvus]|uniref:hypothetical protein n=1 Tax=Campylobacter curvus TaxID=200 RepID=UPI00201683A7|nr:hypothetical protein [Campylobacter curvus]
MGFSLYGRYFHKFEDKYDYENPKNSEQNYGAKLIYNVTDDDALILDLKRAKGINTRTVGRTSYLGYKSHENDENTQISLSHSGRYNDKLALHLHYARYHKIRLRPRAKRYKAAFQRFQLSRLVFLRLQYLDAWRAVSS